MIQCISMFKLAIVIMDLNLDKCQNLPVNVSCCGFNTFIACPVYGTFVHLKSIHIHGQNVRVRECGTCAQWCTVLLWLTAIYRQKNEKNDEDRDFCLNIFFFILLLFWRSINGTINIYSVSNGHGRPHQLYSDAWWAKFHFTALELWSNDEY